MHLETSERSAAAIVETERPELNQLMAGAHRRKFDAVLVWKIDRFGRALKHLVNGLARRRL